MKCFIESENILDKKKGARESMYYSTNIKAKYGITGKKTL